MNKIIYYCWFGPKPLPKLAKKCIKSWKKYLPDFEIRVCNESNFDVNKCEFVKQAYNAGKWAFVSDYARLCMLYETGGIYFDTDMEVLSNIDFLLDNEFFIGREYSSYIAAGVIGVKNEKNKYIGEMLDYYNSITYFNTEDLFSHAIPKVVTKVLEKYKHVVNNNIEIYNNDCYVYPVDYFYPLSYDRSQEYYSKKTCMLHYYDATWIPKKEKITLFLYRNIGKKTTQRLYGIGKSVKKNYLKISKFLNRGLYLFKKCLSIQFNSNKRIKLINENIYARKNKDLIVITNPDWIGVCNSTKELFEDVVLIREVYKEKEAINIAKEILKANPKMVIFSGFALRWWQIAKKIKESDSSIVIKVIWHGGNALLIHDNDFLRFCELIYLCDEKIVSEIGFLKQCMTDLFKLKGYNVCTLYNIVNINKSKLIKNNIKDTEKVKIGIYLSRDRWEKNMYNQLSAASLIENSKIDIIPLTNKVRDFSKMLKINVFGNSKIDNIDGVYNRLLNNDINVYVTFTECAPLIPLESFELGIPCITSNTNDYWCGTELEEYLVVNRVDDIIAIKEKIEYCLKNKEKVLELYKKWKIDYVIKANICKEKFLNNSKE